MDTERINVETIVSKYLQDNGYDGLCSPDGDCKCDLEELFFYCHEDIYWPDCLPADKTHFTKTDRLKENKKKGEKK